MGLDPDAQSELLLTLASKLNLTPEAVVSAPDTEDEDEEEEEEEIAAE
jgi:phage terminase small subunit